MIFSESGAPGSTWRRLPRAPKTTGPGQQGLLHGEGRQLPVARPCSILPTPVSQNFPASKSIVPFY
jgi:hypothetical protein